MYVVFYCTFQPAPPMGRCLKKETRAVRWRGLYQLLKHRENSWPIRKPSRYTCVMTVRVRLRAINNAIITRGLLQQQEDQGQGMESESCYVCRRPRHYVVRNCERTRRRGIPRRRLTDDTLPVPLFGRLKVKWLYPESIRLLCIHEHHP